MRDADFHLPQAFVGALLAALLLVAELVANGASAAPAGDGAPVVARRAH